MTSSRSSVTPSAVFTVSSRKAISPEVGCGTSGIGPGASSSVRPEIDPAQLLGHGEDEAVELAGDRNGQRRSRIAERLGVEHQVGAAAGPQLHRRVDLARPHAGGVDDRAGRDVERFAGELVGQPHRGAGGLGGRDLGQDPGAVLRGGARDRGDQSGVVDQLPVVGQQAAVETVAPHGRRHLDGRLAEIRRERGSVDAGVPASLRSTSPARNPARTNARSGCDPSTAAAEPAAASR